MKKILLTGLSPNSNFVENQVVNWTYSNRRIRYELKVGIAYGTEVCQAEYLFLADAGDHASVLKHNIYSRLTKAGIKIPFPQRVIRINLAHPLPARMTNERYWEVIDAI